MFTQKSASSFRWSVLAAGLLVSATAITASHPALSNDDLFEPLPEGFSPPAYSSPRVDIDARSGTGEDTVFDGGPEIIEPGASPAVSEDNPFGTDNVIKAPMTDGETFTFDQATGSEDVQSAEPAFDVSPATDVAAPAASRPSATSKTAQKPAKKLESNATSAAIFDLRAKQKLEAEVSTDGKPHPLALSYPDHFTVVCEAGCRRSDADIVYQERQDARGPINEPGEEFAKLPVEAAKNVVLCVGGCYHGERVPEAIAGLHGLVPPSSAGDSAWMSNEDAATPAVKTLNGPKSDASGRWFDRVGG
ncbi:MAG: hypothetical protein AAFR75_04150 [Pseudomonadota bacterium]